MATGGYEESVIYNRKLFVLVMLGLSFRGKAKLSPQHFRMRFNTSNLHFCVLQHLNCRHMSVMYMIALFGMLRSPAFMIALRRRLPVPQLAGALLVRQHPLGLKWSSSPRSPFATAGGTVGTSLQQLIGNLQFSAFSSNDENKIVELFLGGEIISPLRRSNSLRRGQNR